MNFLYVVGKRNPELAPVKIGMTMNPARRLATLQTGCPFRLHIHALFALGTATDADIHRIMPRNSREMGEWFSVSAKDATIRVIRHWPRAARSLGFAQVRETLNELERQRADRSS